MFIDDSKLDSYNRDELEKVKMAIDITKVIHDMEMDKQRFENERLELQARISKMQAEVDEVIKKTKHHPSSAIIVALIACFGSIVVALIAAATFWLRNPV